MVASNGQTMSKWRCSKHKDCPLHSCSYRWIPSRTIKSEENPRKSNVYNFMWTSIAIYPSFLWALSKCILDPQSPFCKSVVVEKFIIQDKSICLSVTSSAILLLPALLLCFNWASVISLQLHLFLYPFCHLSLMAQRLILHTPVTPFNYGLSYSSVNQ